MIVSLLLKYWKTILDALLIVVALALILLWNPFNMFGGGLKLQNTANMVSEIKEIGELVTAEYYGEVIASNEEAELEILEKDSIERLGELLYFEIKKSINDQYQYRSEELEGRIEEFKEKKQRKKRAIGL